jgi:hypothetical protein
MAFGSGIRAAVSRDEEAGGCLLVAHLKKVYQIWSLTVKMKLKTLALWMLWWMVTVVKMALFRPWENIAKDKGKIRRE